MHFSRITDTFLSVRQSFKGTRSIKARSLVAGGLMSLAVAAATITPGTAHEASAKTTYSPTKQVAQAQFLTLPFVPNSHMHVLSGWYYSGGGGFHGGIDFINGNPNSMGWRTFPVIAAADGEACGNCTSRQGNAVWVKHNVNGSTYYTYYGHLASISKNIPIGSQSRTVVVHRGDVLGMAGDTGASGALHLHFGLYNSASQPLDPYSIGKLREYYPQPSQGSPGIGWFLK